MSNFVDPQKAITRSIEEQFYDDDDKMILHQRSELFESRINDGKDLSHNHPAKSASMAEVEKYKPKKKLKMTQEERYRFDNYTTRIPKTKIPPFWEKRPWDKESDKMNEDEVRELKLKMYEISQIPRKDDFTFTQPPPPAARCPHIEQELELKSHSIRLSIKDHVTDDSDTDTEII